ncbi:hypothetical protein [Bradyrhizobium sp. STM 3562]|uniref:hypothetical protein n=1 Tax=Bradyrhizobium sp. STM 3562 TaxID=578924 RepID=UPI00388FFBEE
MLALGCAEKCQLLMVARIVIVRALRRSGEAATSPEARDESMVFSHEGSDGYERARSSSQSSPSDHSSSRKITVKTLYRALAFPRCADAIKDPVSHAYIVRQHPAR